VGDEGVEEKSVRVKKYKSARVEEKPRSPHAKTACGAPGGEESERVKE
jgi:hypothetical protein